MVVTFVGRTNPMGLAAGNEPSLVKRGRAISATWHYIYTDIRCSTTKMHYLAFFLGCLVVARYRHQSRGTVVGSLSSCLRPEDAKQCVLRQAKARFPLSPREAPVPRVIMYGVGLLRGDAWSAWQCLLGSLRKEWSPRLLFLVFSFRP